MEQLFLENKELIFWSFVTVAALLMLLFAWILHQSRKPSMKATDYYLKLEKQEKDKAEEDDNSEEALEPDEGNSALSDVDEEINKTKQEHQEAYERLLAMHMQQKLLKDMKEKLLMVDDSKMESLPAYMTLQDFASLFDVPLDQILGFFIIEGLIEHDGYSLRLTEKSEKFGAMYRTDDDVEVPVFPKEILYLLHKKRTIGGIGDPSPFWDEDKKNDYSGWVILALLILGYLIFVK